MKDKATLEQSMRLNMLGLFNRKLHQLRRAAVAENAKSAPRDDDRRLRLRRRAGAAHGYGPLSPATTSVEFSAPLIEARPLVDPLGPGQRAVREPISSDRGTGPSRRGTSTASSCSELQGLLPAVAAAARRRRPSRAQGRQDLGAQEVTVSQKMASGWSWYYAKDESPDDDARRTEWRPSAPR